MTVVLSLAFRILCLSVSISISFYFSLLLLENTYRGTYRATHRQPPTDGAARQASSSFDFSLQSSYPFVSLQCCFCCLSVIVSIVTFHKPSSIGRRRQSSTSHSVPRLTSGCVNGARQMSGAAAAARATPVPVTATTRLTINRHLVTGATLWRHHQSLNWQRCHLHQRRQCNSVGSLVSAWTQSAITFGWSNVNVAVIR